MARKPQQQIAREQFIRDEVCEILTMFRALRRSYDALQDKSGIQEVLITFDGFDANDDEEHEYLRIADGMTILPSDIEALNSHMPRLRGYQMMLQAWRNSHDKENLTKEDITRIIGTGG